MKLAKGETGAKLDQFGEQLPRNLTARGDRFTDETRHWLDTHGFPRVP